MLVRRASIGLATKAAKQSAAKQSAAKQSKHKILWPSVLAAFCIGSNGALI